MLKKDKLVLPPSCHQMELELVQVLVDYTQVLQKKNKPSDIDSRPKYSAGKYQNFQSVTNKENKRYFYTKNISKKECVK